uniref:Uncharacterized protein n=1 Tax=Lygus hesperus TaxID=30085 RepID=A0A146LXR7_LYGHE
MLVPCAVDPHNSMSASLRASATMQRQAELWSRRPMPIPQKDYGRWIVAVFENETELIRQRGVQGADTPEPIDDPLSILRDVAEYVRVVTYNENPSVRVTNGDGGVMALSKVTRWIAAYQQITIERDELLQQQAKLREEREEMKERWEEERRELISQLEEARASRNVAPPPMDVPPVRTPEAEVPIETASERKTPDATGTLEAEPQPNLDDEPEGTSLGPPTPMVQKSQEKLKRKQCTVRKHKTQLLNLPNRKASHADKRPRECGMCCFRKAYEAACKKAYP